jgi:Ribosomal protein L13
MQRQTTLAKPAEIKRTWYLVDATDIPLGRLSSKIAVITIAHFDAYLFFWGLQVV